MLIIDGSRGEGGGQILRTSLSLSLITGTPLRLDNIRAKRDPPGLQKQHLTAVRAAAEIGRAEVAGDSVGSSRLEFRPGKVQAGDYEFRIGTAGSTTLVLQTVLPPLLTASGPSRIVLEGGTHNIHAPPFEYLSSAFVPLLNLMGATVTVRLGRYGFYPNGGGRISATVGPPAKWRRLDLPQRGPPERRSAVAVVSRLPRHIAERELDVVRRKLGWPDDGRTLTVVELPEADTQGPGNVLLISVGYRFVGELFTGFGQRGVRAEEVARGAAARAAEYMAADAPVGPHLADQLLLPMALAGGGSFRSTAWTPHAQTNAEVIREFLPVRVRAEPAADDDWHVTVEPSGS
jgi:RNA 3'-terminal phosphate cyclase (ATP)